ncbi:MAG: RsmD family RNA methyltransferase [Firmicutes bacterium]|nr:RsmD family RNA methyltransferase [Bacillota bacterium]
MGDITGGAAKPVTRVYNTDFAVALRKLEGEQFDLIFLDPPYFDNLEQKCLDLIEKHSVLAANGMIVFEHHGKNDLSKHAQGYIIDTRKFGSILISFLQKEHGI